jgi:hypothetical protein
MVGLAVEGQPTPEDNHIMRDQAPSTAFPWPDHQTPGS